MGLSSLALILEQFIWKWPLTFLRWYSSQRFAGYPAMILSDNGSQMVEGEKELRKMIEG